MGNTTDRPDPWRNPADWHRSIDDEVAAESASAVAPVDPDAVARSGARAKASYRPEISRAGAERYVREVLGEKAPAYDVEAIADELHTAAGSWDMRRVESGRFWAAVRRHALVAGARHCQDWPLCDDGCGEA